jgi:polyferredoxin
MNDPRIIRVLLAALWGLFLGLYLVSKVHFFIAYDPWGVGGYLKRHSIYWVAMAAVVFAIWLVSRLWPQQPR